MNKTLAETNPHLADPAKRAQDVARSVASSLAIEGVHTPQISDTYRPRVMQAILETYALLNRELGYTPHLRNQERIAFYFSHIEKLNAMLVNS